MSILFNLFRGDTKMQQKQAVRILEDDPTPQLLELYTLEHEDYLTSSESIIAVTNNKPDKRVIPKLCTWTLRLFRLPTVIVLKILSWLSRLGSDEIDVKAIEVSHNYHLGMRMQGMGR